MHKKEYLPACYRYIKEDNRSHILFTLATKNTKNNTVSAAEFHSLLCAAELSSIEEPLPELMEEVSCFTIVSNYKCGYLRLMPLFLSLTHLTLPTTPYV